MDDSHESGVLFGTDLSIRIGIFSALVILVVGFSVAYWFLPSNRDTVTFVALALTAAGTLGGTFYLAETIRDQNRQQRNTYAFSLMARWNSPDLFHARRYWLLVTETFQKPGKEGGPDGVEALLSKTPTNEEERNAVTRARIIRALVISAL
jgi:hypothetical protein